jgi:hypothetical protein
VKRRQFIMSLAAILVSPMTAFKAKARAPFRSKDDLLSEQATLGALLWSPEYLPRVESIVDGWMFRGSEHRAIFEWMVDRRRLGLPYDADTLKAQAAEAISPALAAGIARLVDFMETVPCPAHASEYAWSVRLGRPGLRGALERRGSGWQFWR